MGKSSSSTTTTSSSHASCFKIIACGSHDADVDDDVIPSPQTKASSTKRGWSFRKRSGRHQTTTENVISETVAINNKDTPQVTNAEYQVPVNSKTSEEEKSKMSKPAEKTDKVVFASELVTDSKPSITVSSDNDEKAGQVHQAEMVSDTKEEARVSDDEVVVGNVVDASIVEEKMDVHHSGDSVVGIEEGSDTNSDEPNMTESGIALEIGDDDDGDVVDDFVVIVVQSAIRGFLARIAITKLKSAVKIQAAIRGHLVRRNAVETLHCIRAIVKVQSLVRARSFKSLGHGYKPNNAPLSTVKLIQNSFARQLLESTPKTKPINIRCDPLNPNSAWGWLERWMAVSASEVDQKSTPVVECRDDNVVVTDVGPYHYTEENHMEYDVSVDTFDDDAASKMDARNNGSSHLEEEVVSVIDKTSLESMKRPASEDLDGDGKRFALGLRKASNPAFIAAQSKFEELSRSLSSSSSQDVRPVSELETISSPDEASNKSNQSNEPPIVETSHANELIVNETASVHLPTLVAASECGTELSISSTLDSPVRSDTEANKVFGEVAREPHTREGSSDEVNGMVKDYSTDLPSVPNKAEEGVEVKVNSKEEEKHEMNVTELEQVSERKHKPNDLGTHEGEKLSPEASPKSRRTAPESYGTPSSQVSVKSKKSKGKKKTPSKPDFNPGVKSSSESLHKEGKNGKRRNSFGSSKSENADQEVRESSGRSCVPSYMQATESARAKAHSPRSSPDVNDKEVLGKKRHSLPGPSGRQESPRIQRSTSNAAQGEKANGSNERKWQR